MNDTQNSIAMTAYRVMFYVALEQYQPAEHRLVHDDIARQMLPRRLRNLIALFGFNPLRSGFLKVIELGFPGTLGCICRKRYIDDQLVDEIKNGYEAVVILGAGLDTLAYRLPQLKILPTYEVDLPQIITYKQHQLKHVFGSIPSHVTFVPIDFDHQPLEDALNSNGCPLGQKTFYIWEGVTQYLSETAVRNVFQVLSRCAPASRIVFSYIVKDFVDGTNLYNLNRLYEHTRSMWRFGLQPSQVARFIEEFSWNILEQVGPNEYRQRYLAPLGRSSQVMEIERMAYAERRAEQ